MLNLILATTFSAGFGLIVRHAQGRRCNMWAVGALNYATAALVNLGLQVAAGDLQPQLPTVVIGTLGGLSYVIAYFVLFELMSIRGVAISTAVVRMAVLVPVIASVAWWGERPTPAQGAGTALALVALPLLGINRSQGVGGVRRRAVGLLLALFVLNGLNLLALRAFRETGIEGESSLFLALLFGTAAVVSAAAWYRHREGTALRDLVPGLALGANNALGNVAMVAALQELPGFLVFPFHSAVGLAMSVAAARLAWNERVNRLETAGIAVALTAAVFINLG